MILQNVELNGREWRKTGEHSLQCFRGRALLATIYMNYHGRWILNIKGNLDFSKSVSQIFLEPEHAMAHAIDVLSGQTKLEIYRY
jgi:hypothetical protein